MNRGKRFVMKVLHGYFISIAALFVVLLIASLVLSIYVDGVEGLLTPRGVRWMCSNIVANFASLPLAHILLTLMGVSVLKESGFLGVFCGHISMKQKRALQITCLAVLLVVALFLLLLLLPDAVLLSAFGTVDNSALSKGLFGLVVCMAMVVGNVYGYTSGHLVGIRDHVQAHVAIFSKVGGYFVLLFMASQLVGGVEFTGISHLLGDDWTMFHVLKGVVYYIPLILYIFLAL